MFRYERPQKGRTRQFHQASAEVFGIEDHNADAELIMLALSLWQDLGIENQVNLEINSLGSVETRKKYRNLLQDYFDPFLKDLDKDSQRKIKVNPLRILDSKSEKIKSMLLEAPKILDYLDEDSKGHFHNLMEVLSQAGIPFEVNHRMVRGLDYYNKTECGTKGCYLGWLVFVPSNIFSINKTVEEIDRFPKVFLDFRKYGKELKEHYTLPYNMLSYLDVCLLNGQCETPKSLEEIINTINNYFENL